MLLVMDVVESVRIMEQDQDDFVRRWQQLVQHAEQQVLPLHGGRIVKSLGDGLMLEFATAQGCVKAAFALHHFSAHANEDQPPEHHMHLRMGAHLAEFVTDKHDIYGTDVNLTARIATLAGPREFVVSAGLRDHLTAGLDADIEDLGECHLKHVKEPLRAYRVGHAGHAPVVQPTNAAPPDFRPTIAVIPFEARSNEPEHFVIGELVADGIIAQLSRSADIRVISRLSTTAFRGRPNAIAEIESRLAATFVLSGSYIASSGKILIMAELADARNNQIIWADRVSGGTMDLLQAQSEILNRISNAASRALIDSEVQQSLTQPLPRLDSGSLLLGGITLMHRSSLRDFDRSREVLETLLERHNRAPAPRAWLAKWYTMRVIRGMSDKPEKDTQLALEQTRRAQDLSPDDAFALAIEGYARCQLLGDAEVAHTCIERAIELNPNEPLAWLYKSVWSSMWGGAGDAVTEAEHAAQLSPIDPLKYFFDVILAASYSTNRDYARAIEAANRSLKNNKNHLPTLRVLLGAQGEAGFTNDAKATLSEILRIVPNFTVQGYIAMGSSNSPVRQRQVAVLRALGVPET
ncbi:adenylate cyclase [Polaromonas eurypsychrophila]|uniref:Adenylate cyclase n=1 Tax=Polaromonas eurypsychrophila TaxID=1614635 RepID=A0A916SJL1_9BURK|nr:adenylate cyclase [Polaromonas eurypsychrophila]